MAIAILTWDHNDPNEDGFMIQRKDAHCSAPGTFVDIGSVGPDVLTFTDNASPFPYACYRVRATSAAAGDSAPSVEAGKDLPQRASQARGLRRR